MGAARDPNYLAPATEARVMAAFADSPLLTAAQTSDLLTIDAKTLRSMAERGVIRSVLVGASTRRFTEADVRAYLAGDIPETVTKEKAPCPSTSRQSRASSITTSAQKIVAFTDLQAAKRDGRPNR